MREKHLLLDFIFLTGARCSNQAGNYCIRGTGICFSFRNVRFHLHCFCGAAAVPCCALSLFFRAVCFLFLSTYSTSKEENKCPTWGMYVRPYGNRPRCEAYVASELFLPKNGGGTLGIIKPPVCNYDHKKTTFNHGPLSASHSNLMYFSFLSKRSGRRRPPGSEAPCNRTTYLDLTP